LRGRLERADGPIAVVALGAARVEVPLGPLAGLKVAAPVDLFVRPEQLRIVEPTDPCATVGAVGAQIYQGGHVDIHVACMEAAGGRLLVRSGGHDAITRWPIGAKVGISIGTDEGVAFAPD
jgi:putative spermidine/putrescine transport system ATP-binding protein